MLETLLKMFFIKKPIEKKLIIEAAKECFRLDFLKNSVSQEFDNLIQENKIVKISTNLYCLKTDRDVWI